MKLSIIIINYNTTRLTLNCIQSILNETENIQFEIILIDNNSKGNCIEKAEELDKRVKLVRSEDNLGFGRANNLGMRRAVGEYILLLNSDTIITNNGIEQSLKYMSSNNRVDVLSIDQLNEDGFSIINKNDFLKKFSIWNYFLDQPFLQFLKVTSKIKSQSNNPINVLQLSGAFMLLKKDVFAKSGGFDPHFFMYYEETEWCQRLNKNYNLVYNPNLNFIHLHGESSSRDIMTKQMHLSAGLFWYKKGFVNYFLFLIISYFVYLPSWLIISISSSKRRIHFNKYIKIYKELLPYFLGEILKYSNGFGKRKTMLKLNELG